MFAVAAKQGLLADSTVTDELEASDGEDDSRSRPELQPRLSGDEKIVADANGDESSDDSAVSFQCSVLSGRIVSYTYISSSGRHF